MRDSQEHNADVLLAALAEEYFQCFLVHSPLFAHSLGLPGFDGGVGDPSRAARRGQVAELAALEARLHAIDPAELAGQHRVTWSIMAVRLKDEQAWLAAEMHEVAVSGSVSGDLSMLFHLMPNAPLRDAAGAESYLKRLEALGTYYDLLAERYQESAADGKFPTASGVRQALAQLEGYLAGGWDADPLLRPVPPEGVDTGEWRGRAQVILGSVVHPALRRLGKVWAEVLLPGARDDEHVGLRYVPGGRDGYQALVRLYTTTDLTAEEIHRIGLDALGELKSEIAAAGAAAFGTGDVADVLSRLRDAPELRFTSAEHIVSYVTDACERAREAVTGWFRDYAVPACEIREMSPHQARGGPAGAYIWPAADGSRPGVLLVNTHEPQQRSTATLESLAFHEAVPGHHLQAVLGAEADLPNFRRFRRSVAHAEGWGLYAERLADEMGLYSSESARIGMLSEAAVRACRLVVDTGLHHYGWSRDQAIVFMRDNTAQSQINIEAEVDRYISMPAQALGYMLGQLRIQDLRARAAEELGPKFDLAEFHHQVLGHGSVPLDTLDEIITTWIEDIR